jgi:hypothetical protein
MLHYLALVLAQASALAMMNPLFLGFTPMSFDGNIQPL